jgi:tetratricopeptide (TPR) repeat protein
LIYTGRVGDAITHYRKALELAPNVAETHYNLGNALGQMQQIREAIVHYQKALDLNPLYTKAQVNLAWALATAPDASLRDGLKAVELASHANRASGGEDTGILITLAAAYAEARQFAEAACTAQKALRLAQDSGQDSLADDIRNQLKAYQASRPRAILWPTCRSAE